MIRSVGGWQSLKAFSRLKIHIKGDERILGASDVVESVLEAQNELLERCCHLQAQGLDFDTVTNQVAKIFRLKPEQVLSSGKQPQRVKASSLFRYWAVKDLEMSGAKVAQKLEITNSAISRSFVRGEKIASEMN